MRRRRRSKRASPAVSALARPSPADTPRAGLSRRAFCSSSPGTASASARSMGAACAGPCAVGAAASSRAWTESVSRCEGRRRGVGRGRRGPLVARGARGGPRGRWLRALLARGRVVGDRRRVLLGRRRRGGSRRAAGGAGRGRGRSRSGRDRRWPRLAQQAGSDHGEHDRRRRGQGPRRGETARGRAGARQPLTERPSEGLEIAVRDAQRQRARGAVHRAQLFQMRARRTGTLAGASPLRRAPARRAPRP